MFLRSLTSGDHHGPRLPQTSSRYQRLAYLSTYCSVSVVPLLRSASGEREREWLLQFPGQLGPVGWRRRKTMQDKVVPQWLRLRNNTDYTTLAHLRAHDVQCP
jgi:hypothetical protein